MTVDVIVLNSHFKPVYSDDKQWDRYINPEVQGTTIRSCLES